MMIRKKIWLYTSVGVPLKHPNASGLTYLIKRTKLTLSLVNFKI